MRKPCVHVQEFVSDPGINTFEVNSELWKARVRLAVHAAYSQEQSIQVKIRTAPKKGVVAT